MVTVHILDKNVERYHNSSLVTLYAGLAVSYGRAQALVSSQI